MRSVIIEKWIADNSYVHVRHPGYAGIQSADGDVVHDASVEEVVTIGKLRGKLRVRFGTDYLLDGSCSDFCDVCDKILEQRDEVSEIRGRLEDAGFEDLDRYSDIELCWIDWYAREWWLAEASDIENPFVVEVLFKLPYLLDYVSEQLSALHPVDAAGRE